MDTFTLIATESVLRLGSIRAAARELARPASTIAASISRFEAEISVRLVERAGSGLVTTLEAVRLEAEISAASDMARAITPTHTIKLEALDRFVQVTSQGSIRKAARGMGLGQPQLTRQIAQLETIVGSPLLERGADGSTVTPAGARLVTICERLLAAWQKLSRASDERFRKTATTSRLGSVIPLGYESEIARMLANLAARWLAARPRAPLFVSSTTADDLLAGLKSGLFDVAFLDTERLPAEFDGQVVAQTSLAVVGVPDGCANIADALLSAPLAVPSARSGLRQRINRILDHHLTDIERNAVRLIEIDSIPVILNLVLHHGFVSVLPKASVTRIRSDLRQLPLGPQYDMSFWLCWPHGNATIARAIIELLDESSAP
ncbi:LysR family transcriptional regulator [Devosia sp. 2618]|uniref:LysR family transcriptional regulator n=1 Tax=Devosia sp. 2618 TaxID=3156454 RepID=UPI003398C1D0